MKLLFDQNLSFKLCDQLADIFPYSNQVRLLRMENASDRAIWDYAKVNDFVVVSQDADFADFGNPVRTAAKGHLATLWKSAH